MTGASSRRRPRSNPARRVIALPAPTRPPQGSLSLETLVGLLLARAAPFDVPAQTSVRAAWGLPPVARSPWVAYLDPPAATVTSRLLGVRRQLRRLTSGCPPPPSLGAALSLAGRRPQLGEAELAAALAAAGLSDGQAGGPLLVALAGLWQLPLPAAFDPPTRVRRGISALAE